LIDPGKMNQRIRIEQATVAADAYGEPIKSWGVLDHVWAAVIPLRVNERFASQQVGRDVELKLVVHYRTDVTEMMRLLLEGDYYDIKGVTEIGYHEGLELLVGIAKPEGA